MICSALKCQLKADVMETKTVSLAGKISKQIKAYGLTLSTYRSKYPQNRRAKPLVLKKLIFYIKTLAPLTN